MVMFGLRMLGYKQIPLDGYYQFHYPEFQLYKKGEKSWKTRNTLHSLQ